MKIKSGLSLFVCLLLMFSSALLSEVQAAAKPYFRYCSVMSNNNPAIGKTTLIRAEVKDPNGTIPAIIKSIKVKGPLFRTSLLPANYNAAKTTFIKEIPGIPIAGQYSFTVTDTTGAVSTSYFRLTKVKTPPIVDSSTFLAFGNPLTPTLCWSNVAGYKGNLLFKAIIYDRKSRPVWTSVTGLTNVTVPSGILSAGKPYWWSVTAMDNIMTELSDNQSESQKVKLAIDSGIRMGYMYSRVYSLTKAVDSTTYGVIDAKLAIPGTWKVTDLATLTFTGPNGFKHIFPKGGPNFYLEIPGTPTKGLYTFTAKSKRRGTVVSYHYYPGYTQIPLIDDSTLQASHQQTLGGLGDDLTPMLTWATPGGVGNKSLYYNVSIWDTTAADQSPTWVWGVSATNPNCKVPAGKIQDGHTYQWQVDAKDAGWPKQPNNLSRTQAQVLTIDDSKPNFYSGSCAYIVNEHTGTSTVLDTYVNDPLGTGLTDPMTLIVSGPTGFIGYQFVAADLQTPMPSLPWEYEYYHRFDGVLLPDGIYTFNLQYPDGSTTQTLSSSDLLINGPQVPIVDESTLQVIVDPLDPLTPTVSWSAPSGYPGHLSYRIKVYNSDDVYIYNSQREPYTSQTIPAGKLESGKSYKFRVEAQDDVAWPVYNNRSQTDKFPLAPGLVGTADIQ